MDRSVSFRVEFRRFSISRVIGREMGNRKGGRWVIGREMGNRKGGRWVIGREGGREMGNRKGDG